jgi:hypothetical protein
VAFLAPYAIQGGIALAGYLSNRKKQKAAEAQQQQVFGGASGVSDTLSRSGTDLTQLGMGPTQRALSYYDTLLHGNRAAQAQVTAAPRGAITDTYRGATQGLEQSGVRGAARDEATANLNRDRAGKIASLVSGVQPMAANAVGSMGQSLIGEGSQRLGSAGEIWGGLFGQAAKNQLAAQQHSDQTNAQIGSFLFDILNGSGGKTAGGGGGMYRAGPKTPYTPSDQWGYG